MSISESRGAKHPRSIAVVNYKGGVGKTTVTYLLGLYIALQTAKRVLLIDIDAQCSLSLAVGLNPEKVSSSKSNIYHLVKPDSWSRLRMIDPETFAQPVPGLPAPLYIIPGGFQVEDLDVEIVEAILTNRERSKHELFLYCRQLLRSFSSFDFILVDCPPNKMYLTQAMLRASSFFLPVTIPDQISIYGMPRLLRWVRQIEAAEQPRMLGYVLNVTNRQGGSPLGKVGSQRRADFSLRESLAPMLTRFEKAILKNEPRIGEIPRLDAIARFLGEEKTVRLDFARRTSGQPSVDDCLKRLTLSALERIEAYAKT